MRNLILFLIVLTLSGCVPTQKAFDKSRKVNAEQHDNLMDVFVQLGQMFPELQPYIAKATKGNAEVQKDALQPSGFNWASIIASAVGLAIKQIMAQLGLGGLIGGGGLATLLTGTAVHYARKSKKNEGIAKQAAGEDPEKASETLRRNKII